MTREATHGTPPASSIPSIKPVGQGSHVVRDGECMNSISVAHGFFWETLWTHPDNRDLKVARESPDLLLPGDRVAIPKLREKQVKVKTEATHVFRRRGVPAWLRLRFVRDGLPREDEHFIIEIDGILVEEGELDGEGRLEVPIDPEAQEARVLIGSGAEPSEYRFALGTVSPLADAGGLRHRLRNLGFLSTADDSDDAALIEAISAFQQEHNLDVTGEYDDRTREMIAEAHGS